jgi:hypothetical protein
MRFSLSSRVGAACLIVGPLVALASVLIDPTISDEAADQAQAVVAHADAVQGGVAVNALGAVLVAAGLVWLAWVTHPRAPRLAVAGGALGVIGLFAVAVDDGLTLAGAAVARGLDVTRATALLDPIYSGGLAAVGVISVLNVIGMILLAAAALRSGVTRWAPAAIIVGAVVNAAGFASGDRYLAAVSFAVLALGFAGSVRALTADAPAPARVAGIVSSAG